MVEMCHFQKKTILVRILHKYANRARRKIKPKSPAKRKADTGGVNAIRREIRNSWNLAEKSLDARFFRIKLWNGF